MTENIKIKDMKIDLSPIIGSFLFLVVFHVILFLPFILDSVLIPTAVDFITIYFLVLNTSFIFMLGYSIIIPNIAKGVFRFICNCVFFIPVFINSFIIVFYIKVLIFLKLFF